MGPHLQRAFVLFEQARPELAENELRQALAADPDDPLAHALLALCLASQKKYSDATVEAQAAIHKSPDMAFGHYVYAHVLHDRNRLAESLAAVEEAIRLDPADADHFGLLAQIRLDQRNWPAALEAAERGLALDSEDVACTNLRAVALVNLGRREEAGATIGAALRRHPENAVTHANQGWTLLHEGQPKKAMEHFREALRLDPDSDWARRGIVEALKARHFIYRWMLAYFLFMARLSGRAQWAIIIGGYVGYRLLGSLARQQPELAPWIAPLLIAYIVFALLTWLAYPLFNLLLRLNRFGRLALSRDQVVGANWVGGTLLMATVPLVAGIVAGEWMWLLVAAVCGLLVLPLSAVHRMPTGWPRRAMAAYTAAMALLGLFLLGPVLLVLLTPEKTLADIEANPAFDWLGPLLSLALRLPTLFAIGILLSSFVANYLSGVRPKR